MCRYCDTQRRNGARYCADCGNSLRSSSNNDLTAGVVGVAVGAATDSALLGGLAGAVLGGSLVGGILGGLGGDFLNGGSIDD